MMEFVRVLLLFVAVSTLAYQVRRNWSEDKKRALLTIYEHDVVERLRATLTKMSDLHRKIVDEIYSTTTSVADKEVLLNNIYDGPLDLHLQELGSTLIFLNKNAGVYLKTNDIVGLVKHGVLAQDLSLIYDDAQVEFLESIVEIISDLKNGTNPNISRLSQTFIDLETGINSKVSEVRAKIIMPSGLTRFFNKKN